MQVRKLIGAEALDALEINAVSFEWNELYNRLSPDFEAMRAGEKPIPFPQAYPEQKKTLWGAFDDAGKLTASLIAIDMAQSLDGKALPMVGIAGVCSLPEKRRGGAVRELFGASLSEARAAGCPLSYLYPFSNVFYARLGYEVGCTVIKTRFPMRALECFDRHAGSVRRFEPSLLGDVAAIYEAFAARYNGMVTRTADYLWKELLLARDAISTRRWTYVWYDDAGTPGAYVRFQTEKEAEDKVMSVQELCFVSPEALRGMFGFLRQLSAQYACIEWKTPSDFELSDYLEEPYDLKRTLECRGQTRILDVPRALSAMRHPEGRGSYTLSIADGLLPENTGTWRIDYADHLAEVRRTTDAPDAELSVQALAALVTGARSLPQMTARTDVRVLSGADTLARVFRARPTFIADFF